eukprot:1157727-Pelagomonas_calceolata.AAC.11
MSPCGVSRERACAPASCCSASVIRCSWVCMPLHALTSTTTVGCLSVPCDRWRQMLSASHKDREISASVCTTQACTTGIARESIMLFPRASIMLLRLSGLSLWLSSEEIGISPGVVSASRQLPQPDAQNKSKKIAMTSVEIVFGRAKEGAEYDAALGALLSGEVRASQVCPTTAVWQRPPVFGT